MEAPLMRVAGKRTAPIGKRPERRTRAEPRGGRATFIETRKVQRARSDRGSARSGQGRGPFLGADLPVGSPHGETAWAPAAGNG